MTQSWYYAAGPHRHGPLSRDALVRAHQQGVVRADTPVWREGLGDWRPFAAMAAELGIAVAGAPPPLPGSPAPPPARRGLHGAWVAVIVLAGLAVVAVPLLAVLAAIAIPAYNDYTLRSRIAVALAAAEPLKAAVAQSVAEGHCPTPDDAPHDAGGRSAGDVAAALAALRADPAIASARVARDPVAGDCVVHLRFGDLGDARVDGTRLALSITDQGGWRCRGDAPERLIPAYCRH